jgi:hypothetical protein
MTRVDEAGSAAQGVRRRLLAVLERLADGKPPVAAAASRQLMGAVSIPGLPWAIVARDGLSVDAAVPLAVAAADRNRRSVGTRRNP